MTTSPAPAPSSRGADGLTRLSSLRELPSRLATTAWRESLLVMALAAALYIPFLGSFGLWDPWETHYGEVARHITESNDWISTWWGSKWQDAGGAQEGEYFFSKPILLMWIMAMGMTVFGVNAFAVRLGVCLIAILGVTLVHAMGRSVFSRRAGWLMAGVTALAPFYAMLSRQAQTDMPFVGLMTVGLCFFMMAIFGKDRDAPADRLAYGLTFSWVGLVSLPQLALLVSGLARWRGSPASALAAFTASPRTGMVVASALVSVAALMWIAALWIGRSGEARAVKARRTLALASLGALWVPLLVMLIVALVTGQRFVHDLYGWFAWGGTQTALYATCLGGALYSCLARPALERRHLYLIAFYVFMALATLAKGLLGFMLPGAILFFYILLTRDWRLLRQVELWRGSLIFIAVSFPWYAAMLIRHPVVFWNRFFVHDHFKRLTSGVHAVDEGSFEHFARWLGYGLYPFSALVPAAIARPFARYFSPKPDALTIDTRDRATLMLLLWAVFAFTLFTLSSTKFHHYIFPVFPPLAMLVGLLLDDVLDGDEDAPQWPLLAAALGIVGLVAWDLVADPQSLKNLFTYKYERTWNSKAWDHTFKLMVLGTGAPIVAGMGLLLAKRAKLRRAGVIALGAGALVFVWFNINVSMPWYSSAWSQERLWTKLFEQTCTRVEPRGADKRKPTCEEPIVGFNLNWRGETFYTHNQLIPIRDDDDLTHFLSQYPGQTFYGIIEMPRYRSELQRKLPPELRGKACIVFSHNPQFALFKVPCAPDDPQRQDELPKREP